LRCWRCAVDAWWFAGWILVGRLFDEFLSLDLDKTGFVFVHFSRNMGYRPLGVDLMSLRDEHISLFSSILNYSVHVHTNDE